jgi:hypothetical protein
MFRPLDGTASLAQWYYITSSVQETSPFNLIEHPLSFFFSSPSSFNISPSSVIQMQRTESKNNFLYF